MSDINDLISRQAAIDAFWQSKVEFRPSQIDEVMRILDRLPSAQTDLITKIQNEIKVTDANDVYSCGMRNGMRWCLSLIDGKEPLYESPLSNVAVMMQVILDESRKEQDE